MRITFAVLPLLAVVGVASAQQRPDPLADLRRMNEEAQRQRQEEERKAQAERVATKAAPMAQSLERLLTDGWIITSAGIGQIGTRLVLHMPQQRKWALCDVLIEEGSGLAERPVSRCAALN